MKKRDIEEFQLINQGYSPVLAAALARKQENKAKWLKKGNKKLMKGRK